MKKLKSLLLLASLAMITLTLASCGSGLSDPSSSQRGDPGGGGGGGSSGYSFAYVSNNNSNDVQICSVNQSDGTLSGCTATGETWPAVGVTTASIGSATVAYVSAMSDLWFCSVDTTDGTLSGCTQNTTKSWQVYGPVAAASIGGSNYVYVPDSTTNNVWICKLASDGSFNACLYALVSNPGLNNLDGVSIQAVNGNTYAYLSDEYNDIYVCSVLSTGAITSCSAVSSSGRWSHEWGPVAFYSSSGTTYAYISDRGPGTSAIWKCTVSGADGSLGSCAQTPTSGAPSWTGPQSITIDTEGSSTFAYISDANQVWKCTVSSVDGSLSGCATTGPTDSNYAITGISVAHLSGN